MSKTPPRATRAASAEPQISQDRPTAPRPRDAQGRELDQWGLPMGGRVRAAALEAADRREPRDFPEDWEGTEFLGFVDVSSGTTDEPGAGDRTADVKGEISGGAVGAPADANLTEKD